PMLATDGLGGAFIEWVDVSASNHLMAHHLTSAGVLDPAWTAGGVEICNSLASVGDLVQDGSGGALMIWVDTRGPGILAAHLLSTGLDPNWPVHGAGISGGDGDRQYPGLIWDGANGAIATWADSRGGGLDIYSSMIPTDP